jgi:hypothetical protein
VTLAGSFMKVYGAMLDWKQCSCMSITNLPAIKVGCRDAKPAGSVKKAANSALIGADTAAAEQATFGGASSSITYNHNRKKLRRT